MPASELFSKRVRKEQTYQDFKKEVLHDLKLDGADARLWVLVNRQNKTVRPDAPVPDNDPTLSAFTFPLHREQAFDNEHSHGGRARSDGVEAAGSQALPRSAEARRDATSELSSCRSSIAAALTPAAHSGLKNGRPNRRSWSSSSTLTRNSNDCAVSVTFTFIAISRFSISLPLSTST